MAPPVELIEDAANVLAWRGHVEPDENDEWDAEFIAELIESAQEGCQVCRTPEGLCGTADAVADHWLARRQEAWERCLPTWTCDCGRVYKVIPGHPYPGDQYYEAREDGLLGDVVGSVHIGSKGQVKHSDACADCGRRFADTIARQTSPQQALF